MPSKSMPKAVPNSVPGAHREAVSRLISAAEQTAFSWDRQQSVITDQLSLRAMFCAMVRIAGGADWLTAALNREPSYASKITEAMNGIPDRKIQLEWMAPLLADPRSFEIMINWLSERGGYSPPIRNRKVSTEDEAKAAREVLREMPEELREIYQKKMAKKLGVRPEDVRL